LVHLTLATTPRRSLKFYVVDLRVPPIITTPGIDAMTTATQTFLATNDFATKTFKVFYEVYKQQQQRKGLAIQTTGRQQTSAKAIGLCFSLCSSDRAAPPKSRPVESHRRPGKHSRGAPLVKKIRNSF